MNTSTSGPILKNRLVLVAGSVAADASPEKLDRAHEFVRTLTTRVMVAGGGLIVFAGDEPLTTDGRALVFDWTVLRVLAAAAPRLSCRSVVITSAKAQAKKMTDEHRRLLAQLSARDAIEVITIPEDVHTGGNIGDEQTQRADAMIALGGGKGIADRARKLRKLGKPVLPLDLALGALSNDGEGALALHRQLMENPTSLFPRTGPAVASMLLGMSLEAPVLPLDGLAERALTIISTELVSGELQNPEALILTALPVELSAVREALGLMNVPHFLTPDRTHYWARRVNDHVIAVACFGAAGNVDAAAATTELLALLRPRVAVMVGIAAGMREKCRLGEVILSERIVAYEGAALTADAAGPHASPRPEQYRAPHAIRQALSGYLSDPTAVRARLSTTAQQFGLVLPEWAEAGPVATDHFPRMATFGSGEKLLRDPDKFRALRALHGKIEIAEMEAAGVANACDRRGVPYLVVRGISDFGDNKKDDRFHEIAAKAATLVALDIIVQAITP